MLDKNEKKEISYISVLKAFGIISVVVGHTGSPLSKILYLYHISLFFFISGYFYKEEYASQPVRFVIKRLKSLYLPFLIYEIVFISLHNVFFRMNVIGNNPELNTIEKYYTVSNFGNKLVRALFFENSEILLSTFWFLSVLFTVNILFLLVSISSQRISQSKKLSLSTEQIRLIVITFTFACGVFLAKLAPSFLQKYIVPLIAISMYYLGYLFSKFERKIQFNFVYFLVCLVLLVQNAFYGSKIDLRENSFPSPAYLIFVTALGIYINLYLAKKVVETGYDFAIIHAIGNNSLMIMALHILAFKVVGYVQLSIYNLPLYYLGNFGVSVHLPGWWIPYSIAGVFIPLIMSQIIRWFKKLGRHSIL